MVSTIGDIIETRFFTQQSTQVAVNTVHWRVSSVVADGATMEEVATAMSGLTAPFFKSGFTPRSIYLGTSAAPIWPPTARRPRAIDLSTYGGGTVTGDDGPSQAAAIIGFESNRIGPAGRGRIYVPFIPGAFMGLFGAFNPAYRAILSNLGTAFSTPDAVVGVAGTTVLRPVIYSRRLHTSEDIVRKVIATHAATQKRRGAYGRINADPFA